MICTRLLEALNTVKQQHKRSLCCGPVSVRLFVRLSVMFVHSIQMAEDIIKLLCRPGSLIALVF